MLLPLDLLGAKPVSQHAAGDTAAHARRAFDFVWATGSGMEALDEALRPRPSEPSTFEPSVFADDLFIAELARRCMPVVAEGRARVVDVARLQAVIQSPPRGPEVVARRRGVLRELAYDEDVRKGIEAFYARTQDLRDALESRGAARDHESDQLRRIEVLHALQRTIEALGSGLGGARSMLIELVTWASDVQSSAPFARLCDLLAWEGGASTVDLSVRVGADGTLRGVTILERRDLRHPTGESALSRVLRRLVRVLRGDRWDEREVLARLVDEVMDSLVDVAVGVLRAGLDLEPYLGSLGLRDRARRAGLDACLPAIGVRSSDVGLRFTDLYNPFLLADAVAKEQPPPIPCDIALDGPSPIAVVTGPNSGGKTRLLQSVGVALLLGRGGFFVPASSAAIAWTPAIFASLAQASTHDAPEGRLGTELLRVREVFERARPGCFVLLDELCSGTNPSEAEELVRFVLDELAGARASAIVTTHLLDVARRLESHPPTPLSFLRVELDDDERPTYRFAVGVARSSLARRTAERLGITHEALAKIVRERRERGDSQPETLPEELTRGA